MKKLKKVFKKIKKFSFRKLSLKHIPALIVVLGVVVLGIHYIISSFAASPYGSVNATSGALTSPASEQSCPSGSSGQCILFGNSVNATPTGPAAPLSGWHVDLADGFNRPIGPDIGPTTTNDNLWYPNVNWQPHPAENTDNLQCFQTQDYSSSQVSAGGGMLSLKAIYSPDAYSPATPQTSCGQCNVTTYTSCSPKRNYLSGEVTSSSPKSVPGYKGFTWTPGDGKSTWAFEIVCQWPANSSGLWNTFYTSSVGTWTNERDFFEGYQYNGSTNMPKTANNIDSDFIYQTPKTAGNTTLKKHQDIYNYQTAFNPSSGFHRYTYVVYPNQSWSFYIDGVLQTWVGNNGIAPAETGDDNPMDILINYGLRDNTTTPWTTGTQTMLVKSVAVYQDEANAGQGTTGGGIAPGTVVGN
jgi:hypothetical protein